MRSNPVHANFLDHTFFFLPYRQVFIEKTNDLNKTAKAIFYRAREMNERPAAIERLRQSLNLTRTFVAHVRNQTANATEDEPAWITAAELDTLELLCNDTQEWLEEKIKAQAELPLTESPVLKVRERRMLNDVLFQHAIL